MDDEIDRSTMRQILVPVLLFVAVALSSSKILPLLSTDQLRSQLLGIEGQQNDNTYSFRDQNKNVLNNLFYNIPVDTADYTQNEFDKSQISYSNTDNKRVEYNFNRNGEGFRKEQWHNYPRQLDRLHKYLNEQQNYDKGNIDPDEKNDNYDGGTHGKYRTFDDETNEFQIDPNLDREVNRELTMNNNALLNLKLRLASLRNSFDNVNDNFNPVTQERELGKLELKDQDQQVYANRFVPIIDFINNIRTAETPEDRDVTDDTAVENRTKRIFSLWSRVQGLSHKGHEILQRRRHMHTFYGLPDGDGSRVLTAETRAILMRPPGSPLRWG